MATPETKTFALKILLLFILMLAATNLFGLVTLYLTPTTLIHFAFLIATVVLLYKGKNAGWYMAASYFVINLLLSVLIVVMLYSSLIKNSDSNWGGYLSFLFPLPPIIIYVTGLILCLKARTKKLYNINFKL